MDVLPSPQPCAVGEAADTKQDDNEVNDSYASILNGQKSIEKNSNDSFSQSSRIDPSKLDLCVVNFDQDIPVIKFSMEDINIFTREEGLHQAVVIKFSYGFPHISEVRRIFASQFEVKGRCNVGQLEYRHLLIRFDLFEDYARFIGKSSSFLISKGEEFFFRSFPWTFDFNPKEETSMAAIWISMPGLPPNLFAKRSLLSIASAVGKPIAVDKATHDRTRPSAARVKVIVNLLDNHPKMVKLQFIDSTSGKSVELEQIIVYDNLPSYCEYCKHQGHEERVCRHKSGSKVDYLDDNSKGIENNVAKLQGDARVFLNKKRDALVKIGHISKNSKKDTAEKKKTEVQRLKAVWIQKFRPEPPTIDEADYNAQSVLVGEAVTNDHAVDKESFSVKLQEVTPNGDDDGNQSILVCEAVTKDPKVHAAAKNSYSSVEASEPQEVSPKFDDAGIQAVLACEDTSNDANVHDDIKESYTSSKDSESQEEVTLNVDDDGKQSGVACGAVTNVTYVQSAAKESYSFVKPTPNADDAGNLSLSTCEAAAKYSVDEPQEEMSKSLDQIFQEHHNLQNENNAQVCEAGMHNPNFQAATMKLSTAADGYEQQEDAELSPKEKSFMDQASIGNQESHDLRGNKKESNMKYAPVGSHVDQDHSCKLQQATFETRQTPIRLPIQEGLLLNSGQQQGKTVSAEDPGIDQICRDPDIQQNAQTTDEIASYDLFSDQATKTASTTAKNVASILASDQAVGEENSLLGNREILQAKNSSDELHSSIEAVPQKADPSSKTNRDVSSRNNNNLNSKKSSEITSSSNSFIALAKFDKQEDKMTGGVIKKIQSYTPMSISSAYSGDDLNDNDEISSFEGNSKQIIVANMRDMVIKSKLWDQHFSDDDESLDEHQDECNNQEDKCVDSNEDTKIKNSAEKIGIGNQSYSGSKFNKIVAVVNSSQNQHLATQSAVKSSQIQQLASQSPTVGKQLMQEKEMPNPILQGRHVYDEGEEEDFLNQCRVEASIKGDLSPMHSARKKKSHQREKSWDGKVGEDVIIRKLPMRIAKLQHSVLKNYSTEEQAG